MRWCTDCSRSKSKDKNWRRLSMFKVTTSSKEWRLMSTRLTSWKNYWRKLWRLTRKIYQISINCRVWLSTIALSGLKWWSTELIFLNKRRIITISALLASTPLPSSTARNNLTSILFTGSTWESHSPPILSLNLILRPTLPNIPQIHQ